MTGTTYTVLVADDVAALRNLIRMSIEGGGRFTVVANASNGIEAVSQAGQLHPDLALLDLSMPDMDGLEALPRILETSPNTRVVVLSGFNHIRMAPVALRLGASAYIEKGLEPEALVQKLLSVMEPDLSTGLPAGPPAGSETAASRSSSSSASFPTSPASAPTAPLVPLAPSPPASPGRPASRPARTSPGPARPAAPSMASPAQRADGAPAPQVTRPVHPRTAPSGEAKDAKGRTASAYPFRVLLVSATPARLEAALQDDGTAHFIPLRSAGLEEAQAMLTKAVVDVVVVDPSGLPADLEEGLIALLTAAESRPVVAFVPDGAQASRAMRLGVEDCLPLDDARPGVLGRSILYAVERRKAHEARLLAREHLSELRRMRELERLKTQFFNSAAHELGTPLTPMRLLVHVLKTRQEGREDPIEARSLETLERNIERMTMLTKDLLDVARLQSGHFVVVKRRIDLRNVVQEVADSLGPLAGTQGVELSWSCPVDQVADADHRGLVQVMFNFVHNALKFTPRGGKVTIECLATETETILRVRDTGVGLRPDQCARLFQPFSQVLDNAQPTGIGSGLGLFISRGLVELHGGRIWCESAGPGQGSTFAIALPRPVTELSTPHGSVAIEA